MAVADASIFESGSKAVRKPLPTKRKGWFQVLRPLPPRARLTLGTLSFVLPIALWSIVSYVPAVWHPQMLITDPGSADYLQAGMRSAHRSASCAAPMPASHG
jgi:hypothetical protein